MVEYDIFLKSRLTECDITIYHLPYRDGLTFTHRLYINSELTDQVVTMLNQADSLLPVETKLEDGLKHGFERAASVIGVLAEGKEHIHYVISADESVIAIISEDMPCITSSFMEGGAVLAFISDYVVGSVKRPLGDYNCVLGNLVKLDDGVKTGYEQVDYHLDLTAVLDDCSKFGYFNEIMSK